MRSLALPALLWLGCNGDDVKNDPPPDDGDADTDTDTDTDSDADTDRDSGGPTNPLPGEIASAYYEMFAFVYWNVTVPANATSTTTTGPGDSADSADTGPPVVYFPASTIWLSARFGFDATTEALRDVTVLGQVVAPTIDVVFATPTWDNSLADVDNYCLISLPLTGENPAPWGTGRLWYGVDYSGLSFPISDCNGPGKLLDPAVWTDDPVTLFGAPGDWGVGVGELTTEMVTALTPYLTMEYILGGQFRMPALLPTSPLDSTYGVAYEVDANFVATVSGGSLVPILAEDVDLGP